MIYIAPFCKKNNNFMSLIERIVTCKAKTEQNTASTPTAIATLILEYKTNNNLK